MLLAYVPVVAGAALFLLLPGIVWAWRCYPSPGAAARLSVGLAIGVAFQMHAAALLATGPRITGPSVLVAALLALAVALVLAWKAPHREALARIGAGSSRETSRRSIELTGLVALVAAIQLLPLAREQLPRGWDTSFHALLASTTVASGRLPTWAPYEPIASNYPYGSHVLIAEISLISGATPDRVFAALISGIVPVCTCIALYALARRLLRSHTYALAAVAAYGLLGYFGSIDYAAWGGLPNQLGCFLLLAFLGVLFAPWTGKGSERTRILVGGVILGAIPLAHHHVMLTAALLLGVYGLVAIARARRAGVLKSADTWRIPRRLLLSAAVGVLTSSYYLIPLVLRAGQLGSTEALRYYDTFARSGLSPLAVDGVLLELLALAGCVALTIGARWRLPLIGRGIEPPRVTREFLAVCSATLILAFIVCYYGYSYVTYIWIYHHQHVYTAFTPSRFLTDLTYFLALYAAIPLVAAWRGCVALAHWLTIARPQLARPTLVLLHGGIAVALLATAFGLVSEQLAPSADTLAPGEAAAFGWIRQHTPADTLVINDDPNGAWAPYFTRREVTTTPLPISEFGDGYVAEKRFLVSALMATLAQPQASQVLLDAGSGTALPALRARPVALLATQPLRGASEPPAFTADDERVYLLGKAFARLQPSSTGDDASVRWWEGRSAPPAGWYASWDTSAASEAGWGTSSPTSAAMSSQMSNNVYLRVTLRESAGALVAASCSAQEGATLFVDGHLIPNGCAGQPLAALDTPGQHTLGLHGSWSPGMQPWMRLVLVEMAPVK